jgi:hypothetical protein
MRSRGPVALVMVTLITGGSAAACLRGDKAAPSTERQMAEAGLMAPPATMAPPRPEQLPARGDIASRPQAVAAAAPAPGPQGSAPLAAMTAALKLIRTAQVSVEVSSYEAAAEKVARLAEAHGGYVAESQAGRAANDRRLGTVTLKVPAARFAAALADLKALGTVESEQVATQDVTKAYSDLETRLKVKRDTAERLREILRTRTARLSDVLEAERELARVTEEIEHMEGERRFYDHQVSLSTISAQLHEPEAMVRPGAFAPVSEALHSSVSVLATSLGALIFALVFLTPWLVLALVAWKVVRVVRARRRPPATIAG